MIKTLKLWCKLMLNCHCCWLGRAFSCPSNSIKSHRSIGFLWVTVYKTITHISHEHRDWSTFEPPQILQNSSCSMPSWRLFHQFYEGTEPQSDRWSSPFTSLGLVAEKPDRMSSCCVLLKWPRTKEWQLGDDLSSVWQWQFWHLIVISELNSERRRRVEQNLSCQSVSSKGCQVLIQPEVKPVDGLGLRVIRSRAAMHQKHSFLQPWLIPAAWSATVAALHLARKLKFF